MDAIQDLSLARDLPAIQSVVRTAARHLTGADGATFVLRDRDHCYYLDEDAISPLWKGQRFPLEACISGWAMLNRDVTVIPDIYADARIPHDAYRPTFVKSLVMVPIRAKDPVGAIGNYWAERHDASPDEVETLQALANSAAVAMENVALYQELERRVTERTAELAAANAELSQLLMSDELTGLLNRRGFVTMADHELKVLARAGRMGAVLFVDVDGLKAINDRDGHDAGDRILCRTAAGLRASLRESDLVARLSGDEFAVLVIDLTEAPDNLVARVRRAVAEEGARVSIGSVVVERGGASIDDLLATADHAMYLDKRTRRP